MDMSYTFFLSGDLNQMVTQRIFLVRHGFELQMNNVYPCLKPEDVPRAMGLIWSHKTEGWWHYLNEYVKHNICTKEQFMEHLKFI